MRYIFVGMLFVLAAPSEAEAVAWESKTMQSPFSAREVGRSLKLPKGWMEMSLGADVKLATGYWDSDGNLQEWNGVDWLYTTESISFRYGFSHNSEIYLSARMHYMRLTNEEYNTDTSGSYIGDPTIGAVFSLFEQDAPHTSVVARVQLKSPAGNESPGSYIAGPSTFQEFVTTTGSHDLTIEMAAKRQLGLYPSIAVDGYVGYVNRFSGLVQWLIETTENQLIGRFKPGNRMYGGAGVTVQLGPVALKGGARMMIQGDAKAGTTSGGLSPDGQLLVQEGSGGSYLDANAGLVAHFSRNMDVELGVNVPLQGEDLMFFPLEDLHPTYGNTYSAILKLRY